MSSKGGNPLLTNSLNLPSEQEVELEQEGEQQPETKHSNGSGFSVWLLVGCAIVIVVILIINYFVRANQKKKEDELKELTNKYTELEQENESLQSEIEQLQSDNQNYVSHINRLADELENRQQPKNPYSSVTPMTENSFEAPDPNAIASKPQVVKDKEALKAMVNSKRQTVQDVIDQQQADKKEKSTTSDASAEQEIKNLTHAEDNESDNAEQNNNQESDDDVDVDDKNVNDLMNIIQNQ